MSSSRFARRVATAGALLMLALTPAAAQAGTLDVQTDVDLSVTSGFGHTWDFEGDPAQFSKAQTFTAGLTGALDQVDVHVSRVRDSGGAIIEIRDVGADGLPGSTVLASTTIASASVPATSEGAWVAAQFSDPAHVTSGSRYAIVAYAQTGGYYEWHATESPYSAGAAYYDNAIPAVTWTQLSFGDSFDHAFKTYVLVTPKADLSLTMAGPATVSSKQQVTYLLTVRNAGPFTATNVVLTDNLPYGTQFSTVTPSQGSCTPPGRNGTKVTCQLGTIASGADASGGVTLKITARASSQANINNVASVSSDVLDPNLANNSASFTTKLAK